MDAFLSHYLRYFSFESAWNKFTYETWNFFPLALVILLELVFTGWGASSLRRFFRPGKTDWWDILSFFAFVFNLRRILANLFYFGLIAYLLTVTNPLRLSLFDSWPLWAKFLAAYLTQDFLLYWSHRAKHGWSVAWLAHEFHHSATKISLWTSYRIHPLDFLFSYLWVFFPVRLLFGLDVDESLLFMALSSLTGYLNHSRLDSDFGWWGKWLLVSPRHHHLHHSRERGLQQKNFGEGLLVWDHLFGTHARPSLSIHDVEQGLEGDDYHGAPVRAFLRPVIGFYSLPLKLFDAKKEGRANALPPSADLT